LFVFVSFSYNFRLYFWLAFNLCVVFFGLVWLSFIVQGFGYFCFFVVVFGVYVCCWGPFLCFGHFILFFILRCSSLWFIGCFCIFFFFCISGFFCFLCLFVL